MYIRPDLIVHAKGGLLVMAAAAAFAMLLLWLGAHPVTVALAVAGAVSAGSIEGMQWLENRRGMPRREVALDDFLATAGPCWAACVVIEAWLAWGGALWA